MCPFFYWSRSAKRIQKCMTPLTYKSIQTTDKYFAKGRFKKIPPEKNAPKS